ncbi:MAG: Ig-like domain-containing protein, partial [Anaerolineae bacterium]
MNRKHWLLIPLSLLLLTAFACRLIPQRTTPTPEPVATATPRPTATPLPPKPIVPYTPVPADMLSPIIIQRSPKRGESLKPDEAIEIVFDKPMNQPAVASAFTLQLAGENKPVKGELSWADARTLRFQPAEALPRDTVFDVILTQNASAETGELLREPYTFRFATAGYLEVAQVIPDPDTANVETESTITVMFNRPIVPLTTLAQMEDLPDPVTFDPEIEGSGEWLNTSIYIFTPEEPLAGGVTYRATVNAGLQDIAGAVLAEDYVWHFSTLPPNVVWTRPRSDETLVDINTAISVQFNQPVDLASVERAFTLSGGRGLAGNDVNGTFSVEENTVVFTPTRALDFNTTYTVKLDTGITSAAGGIGMKEAYTWQFTTVPLPEIVSTNPEHLERSAPSYTSFEITFNTPIDPATVMPNLTMIPPFSPTQVYTSFSRYNNTFRLRFGAQPSTEYIVSVTDEIADPYGNTIPRGRTVKFRTAPLDPLYRLHVPDMVGTYDAALPAQLVLSHVNVNRVNLRLYKLPQDALFTSRWQWQEELPSGHQLLREWRQNLESPLNEQSYTVVDLTETPGGTLDPGVYLLETDSPDVGDEYGYYYNRRHIMVVSNLNLTLKIGPQIAFVWATDLRSGAPVSDVSLDVIQQDGNRLGKGTTGDDGIARVGLYRERNTVIVYSEEPFAAVAEGWGRGISPWDFGVGEGEYSEAYRTYVYTDRPIYRPGQTAHFKGVVRSEDDAAYNLPGVRQVQVSIRDAAYEEIYNEQLTLGELGTFDGTLDLADGASLGDYQVYVSFGDYSGYTGFQVAAYRAPEFEIIVETSEAEVQRGDDVAATIAARYFFGGPLADTDVTWNVMAETYRFQPPWGGRYSFSDVDDPYTCFDCWWWWREPPAREAILSGSGTTDANGELAITIDGAALSDALTYHASRITLEATATGPDNQAISGRTSVVVHPGPYYIGLSAQKYVGEAGKPSDIDLVTVDWEGTRLPDKAIQVEFYRREWINTFVENEFGGGSWSWEAKETPVGETTVTTDNLGEAVATFTPAEGGSYHIVATPASPPMGGREGGEGIRSSIFIWVSGKDHVSWRRENNDRITLISDKNTYKVGETAEILIPSPFEGEHYALVTVERASIRRYEIIRLTNNSTIYRLPITEGDIPNIYVSVVLINKRQDGKPADFKMGLLPLDVDAQPVTLNLQLETTVEQAQPGEEVDYTLRATLPNGEPAAGVEFSLDVVDKAVLSLRPRSSDIVQGFYARRMLQVNTGSALSLSVNRYLEEIAEDLDLALAQAADGVLEVYGLGEDEAMEAPAAAPEAMATVVVEKEVEKRIEAEYAEGVAPPAGVEIREEFADTAYWNPRITTDREGHAVVTLTLPDNLTTWTLRAVGLTADTTVGEGFADLVATKPLLVRPVAPRFFVVDDRAQLAANVSNNTGEDLTVEVSLSAEGVGIHTETPPLQTVTIPARSERKVTWWVTVQDVVNAQLIFSAVAPHPEGDGDYADASKPRLSTGPDGSLLVFRYTTPDIVGTAGQLIEGGSRTEAIALPPEFDERRGNLTVQLDPSLAAGMQDGLRYLEHFEYECTEQTVSRFLPNVLTYNALQSLGIENQELAERLPGLVDEGLKKLYLQQNPDGGWGWWYNAERRISNPHVSAYVVFALLKTQQSGITVKQDALSNGIAYLQTQVKDVSDYRNFRYTNRQAWLLYVLAEGNAAPQNTLDELFENRDKLSYYARAYLAQALWLDNRSDSRLDTLLSDLNNAAILSATGAHWEESN